MCAVCCTRNGDVGRSRASRPRPRRRAAMPDPAQAAEPAALFFLWAEEVPKHDLLAVWAPCLVFLQLNDLAGHWGVSDGAEIVTHDQRCARVSHPRMASPSSSSDPTQLMLVSEKQGVGIYGGCPSGINCRGIETVMQSS